jgi:hypothetical protein
MKLVLTLAAMCFIGLALSFAQDANMATWKLNEAKSKISSRAPKNTSVIYQAAGDNVKVTVDGVDPDGKPIRHEWIGKFDGKDYPVIGDPNEVSRSYTKIDDHTLGLNIKRRGNATASGRIVVTPDGKSRTVTMTGTDPTGKTFQSIAVYDKQ